MSHTFSNVILHVIFSTKDRRPQLTDAIRSQVFDYMGGIVRSEFGRPITIGGTENHVHSLLTVDPKIAVSKAMSRYKSLSSGWIHKTLTDDLAWQEGYGAFSVSPSKAGEVVSYITRQKDHHRKTTFEEEFLEFLRRHEIAFDPNTIWE
jgi:REP element-mobilizing transposase RayT